MLQHSEYSILMAAPVSRRTIKVLDAVMTDSRLTCPVESSKIAENSDTDVGAEDVEGPPAPTLQQGYELKMQDLLWYRRFSPGDTFPTYACSVLEPDCLFLTYDEEEAERLRLDLASEIRNTVRLLPKFQDLPVPETVILARYSLDRLWYRAGVVDHRPGQCAEVLYIDYGNHETVSMHHMRPLTERLAQIPRLIIPAEIGGIAPPPAGFTRQICREVENLLLSPDAHAVFRVLRLHEDGHLIGDLFLLQEGTGRRQSIADMFIEKGYAVLLRD